MTATVIWVLVLVVVLIVGPFATLRAVSHYKARKRVDLKPGKKVDDDGGPDDPDKPKGFW
jgi:hypothetical protein